MVVALTALDISINAYLDETISAVKVRDAFGGLVKAFYFGIVIVSVAAHQGFATTGGSRGVGKFVTRSVVQAIIWIIVVDAVFTTILYFTES
jgi:phospholipid/cholesterol/gamma-HCH transport system permease protein